VSEICVDAPYPITCVRVNRRVSKLGYGLVKM
jgi:hypothetical protein